MIAKTIYTPISRKKETNLKSVEGKVLSLSREQTNLQVLLKEREAQVEAINWNLKHLQTKYEKKKDEVYLYRYM